MIQLPLFFAASTMLLLAACAPEPAEKPSPNEPTLPNDIASATPTTNPAPMPHTDAGKTFPSGRWDMTSSGEGDGLFFGVTEGEPGRVHIFCPAGGGMLVNVNAFRPIGSEERMSFGSGGEVVTLVANPAGDRLRGGVSGEGPVPAALLTMLTGKQGVAVNYGAQDIGPLPPVPAETARVFVTGCSD
ncbi:hypothetical protein K3181_05055 [Qipengyuania sp. YG27]|uniref:Lipoprotein n=1 Tax=Qipengyuania mesophila TaxID=2867246 RepID=A0ABS7JT92_9SPHN|nr:hypothetical protein [Qipengyuania mesophila]MBX7500803.1 hypothetical protein [Qipengyuania mesophila]